MATEVKLPRLGQGMESGTIVKWLKSEGEPVEKGEPLYELDTDKVTQEVEAEATGVLLKIAVSEGEVAVGRTIGFIGGKDESVPEVAAAPAEPQPANPPSNESVTRRCGAGCSPGARRGRDRRTAGSRRRRSHAGSLANGASTSHSCAGPARRADRRGGRRARRGSACRGK